MKVKILVYVLPAFILAAFHPAVAQQKKKTPQIGFLCATSGPSPYTEGLLQGLQELGYIEGKNIFIDYRFAAGRTNLFPEFAAELVRRKVDVLVVASPAAIGPAMRATTKIPIVMAQSDDPVLSGFVTSLARPGGNITGLSSMAPELSTKQQFRAFLAWRYCETPPTRVSHSKI
jgi:putative tryptophan/tyrosine transport system substrate-binding protein